ncbi:MAG: hypothetical protein AAF927_11155 [Bacteroidota bacterium]
MNPKQHTFRQSLLLIFFCFGAISLSAQGYFNTLYPTLSLVSANENANSAIYKLSKGGTVFRLSIGINGNNAGYVIQTQASGVVGQGSSTLNGTCETINITKTKKGLLDIWRFAMDRVYEDNGSLAFSSVTPGNSNEALVKYLCEQKCDEELVDAIVADNNKTGPPFYSVVSVGNGTCDGYEPCTMEALQDYNDCVCGCIDDRSSIKK